MFWTDEKIPLEPKRNSRWMLYAEKFDKYFLLSDASKPEFTVGVATHSYMGHEFKFPGKVTWKPITFTIVDPIEPELSGVKQFLQMIYNSGYHPLKDAKDIAFITKRGATAALGLLQIRQLADNDMNNVVEEWSVHNGWVSGVSMGKLDYKSDDLLTATITVEYDWAQGDFGVESIFAKGGSGGFAI
jgi:hypothetical protein